MMECVLVTVLADQQVGHVLGGPLFGLDVEKDMNGRDLVWVLFFQGGHLDETAMRVDVDVLLAAWALGMTASMMSNVFRFGKVDPTCGTFLTGLADWTMLGTDGLAFEGIGFMFL